MNALIVLAHPNPQSFNAGLVQMAEKTLLHHGHAVVVSDLYGEGFDPVEDGRHYQDRADPALFSALAEQRHAWQRNAVPPAVAREISRLEWADVVILQFPLWWHAQPAILKGWFDRVFVSGGLYTSSMRYDRGYFRGKRAIVSVTTGAPEDAFGPGLRGGDMETLLWPIQYSLYYMGFDVLPPFIAHGVQGHGYAYRNGDALARHLQNHKTAWAARLARLEGDTPLPFPGWAQWEAAPAACCAD